MLSAHLYDTLRNKYRPASWWTDTEELLSSHDKQHLFVSEAPATVDKAFDRLSLASGVSLRAFAKNRRGDKMPLAKNQMWSKNGCRLLRERTGLLKALRMRLVEDYETSVEAALVERPKPMFVGHTDGSRKRASSGPIDPIQLMIVLREDLIEERPKLLFDYLSYHKAATCLSILLRTTLTDTINQQMPLFYSNFTRKELLSLPFVISSLVQIMGHKPNGKHTSTGLRTLNIVGDIFERFVAGNGIAAVKGRAKLYEEPVSNSEEGCVRPDDSGSNGGGAGEDGKEQEEARVGRPQS